MGKLIHRLAHILDMHDTIIQGRRVIGGHLWAMEVCRTCGKVEKAFHHSDCRPCEEFAAKRLKESTNA